MSKILRIKEFREIIGLSQSALAQRLNVSLKTMQNYEKGKTDIPSEVITYLCEKFYLNANWLFTGEGDMYRQPNGRSQAQETAPAENNAELIQALELASQSIKTMDRAIELALQAVKKRQ